MKLGHIFWALVIVALCIYMPRLFLPTADETKGGVTAMFFFTIAWIIVQLASPVLIGLAWYKVTRPYQSFMYALAFILNLCFGIFVLLQLFNGGAGGFGLVAAILSTFNLLWAALLTVVSTASRYRTE